MGKEHIHLVQLPEKTRGIEIFRMTDEMIPLLQREIASSPHRHDHYTCFFVEYGTIVHTIDFQEVIVEGPSLLISYPGQMHQVKKVNVFDGWILAFDPKFIHQNVSASIEESFSDIILIPFTKEQQTWFSSLFELIKSEVTQGDSSISNPIIGHLINGFFSKTASLFQLQETERILDYSSRSIEIVKTFRKLVREQFVQMKKPSEYAVIMNISVSYLNDTVKSISGFTATHFIQQEIFRESQRLLCYTNKSIKEIAFQLGYEDYKYFIRLFSKSVGISPSNFRKQNQ
ncbi:helix-turn-helix domain-containing protein [Fluviicola taffensis]|uniref:Transcriptional regulator, AraC family n=1 Tax=Fluviicola taffensis (strain DSM 16823 / NCIMB 13979 / RW262) TaxID=755732 RepID=F2IGA7_FLUTR|nr:helix-turn-helix transcriptional regulator [Fluviicola taffensis]AEA45773.1 transcriptional regulator, AraC family [Fluviicola taffensis DSM 16823]